YRNTITLAELTANFNDFTDDRGRSTDPRNSGSGPISVFSTGIDASSLSNDRYPIDPWGSPYLLYGPDETIYNVRAIYSVGPDGIPGPIPGSPGGGANDFD